jgi:hypothetical protein
MEKTAASSPLLLKEEEEEEKIEHDTMCFMCRSDKIDVLGALVPCPRCSCVVHLACLVRDDDRAGKIITPKCMQGHFFLNRHEQVAAIVSVPTLLQKQVAAGLLPRREYILTLCGPTFISLALVWLVGILARRVDAHLALSISYGWYMYVTSKEKHLHPGREIFPMFMLAWVAMFYVPILKVAAILALFAFYSSKRIYWMTLVMVVGTWVSTEAAPHGPAALFSWTVIWILAHLALRIYDEFFDLHSPHPVVAVHPVRWRDEQKYS